MFKMLFLIIVAVILLSSCVSNYSIGYETYIEKSKDKTNVYADEMFSFKFKPVHSGIHFSIENLTDNSAYLIWDKCYFIEPDGNSYKSLNTDILKTEKTTALIGNNEAIIPPKSKFSRFTNSNTKLNRLTYTKVSKINGYFFGSNYNYTSAITNSYLFPDRYWPLEVEKDKIEEFKNFLGTHNNLGIGFVLRYKDKEYNYKFNLKFKKIYLVEVIITKRSQGKLTKEIEKVVCTLVEEDDWKCNPPLDE